MVYNNNFNNRNTGNQERFSFDWNFLNSGYSSKDNILKENIIRDDAIKVAKVLANGQTKDEKISNTQLRAFYNDVKALENRIDDKKSEEEQQKDYEAVYPFVLMLEAKAAYKHREKNDKIPKMFREFIEKNVEVMRKDKKVKTFQDFCKFFEAVVAYYYGFGGKDNK